LWWHGDDPIRSDQLCGAGIEVGIIEGGIHAVNQWRKEMELEESNGFLLMDARNAFNEKSRAAMLWTVRQEWRSRVSSFPKSQSIIPLRPTILMQQSIRRLTTQPTMETEVISSLEDCGKTSTKR
jgi:hypothetical protein